MTCISCNQEMKLVNLCGDYAGTRLYLSQKEKGFLGGEKRSDVESFVCPCCGEIRLRATKPQVFFQE